MHCQSWCKECKSACDRAYRLKNREALRASHHAYYEVNKKEHASKTKAYYEKNKEAVLAKRQAYYRTHRARADINRRRYKELHRAELAVWHKKYQEENRELIRQRQRLWRARNKEVIKEKKRVYIEANKESHLARIRTWRKRKRAEDPVFAECERIKVRNRRARVHGNGGTHTYDDIIQLFCKQHGLCAICWQGLKAGAWEVDHIYPVSKGGHNGPENLQILCCSCNRTKHDTVLETWEDVERIREFRRKKKAA